MPAAAVTYPHIIKPPGKTAQLADHPRLRVAMLVMDYLHNGWTPEELCDHYGFLSRAEAHAALLYYWDHKGEIDAEIAEDEVLIAAAYATPQPPFIQELVRRRRGSE